MPISRAEQSRRYRAKYPMRAAYNQLRTNTIRRHGLAWFYLTFEEFAQFAIETRYLVGKGIIKTSYCIDRKDSTMGYFIGNIRTVQNTVNNKKRTKTLHYEWDQSQQRMVAWVS